MVVDIVESVQFVSAELLNRMANNKIEANKSTLNSVIWVNRATH